MNWNKSKIAVLILMAVLVLGVMAFPLISSNGPTAPAESDSTNILTKSPTAPTQQQVYCPTEGEAYYDLENVVLYLDAYGELPPNYITKAEAQELGWEGGPVDKYQKGAAIGGDHFGNYEKLLPDGNYTECDIDTKEKERGSKRLVFSDDGHYYYTADHYGKFDEYVIDNGNVVKP